MHTIMKKKYIQPSMLTVKLHPCSVIAYSPESIGINSEGGSGTDLVKEQYPPISDRNVWDEEW